MITGHLLQKAVFKFIKARFSSVDLESLATENFYSYRKCFHVNGSLRMHFQKQPPEVLCKKSGS